MENPYLYSFFYFDGEIVSLESGFQFPMMYQPVYEVFKVIGGIPLFIEDHMERLKQSLILLHKSRSSFDYQVIIQGIIDLCQKNQQFFGNMELMVFNDSNAGIHMSIGFIAHHYPSATDYMQGVKVGLFASVRELPNAKIKNTETRIRANQFLKEKNYYEVLLYNPQNYITEGSRSNVFFLIDGQVFTAPDTMVLKGISRTYVIQVVMEQNMELVEQAITLDQLKDVEAAFLCGTSIGVIPIQSINNHLFDYKNLVIKSIMLGFNLKVQSYLSVASSNIHHSHQ